MFDEVALTEVSAFWVAWNEGADYQVQSFRGAASRRIVHQL